MATFKCLKVGLLIVFVSITAIVERSEGTATADWFESVSGITFARGNVNFALGKPTNQSSTRLNASFAVDGVRTNKPHKCSRTERAKESWWKVDLLDEYIIDFLRIFHSTKFDITGVTISTSRDDVTYTPCSTITQNDTVATKEILKQCDTLQVGRYVRFDKFSTGYLVICELEIYDKEPITTTPAPTTTAPPTTIPDISPTMSEDAVNFALLKRTSQSSTAGGRHSTFAVDGDETSDSKKLCSETGIDYTVWWKVDLRANYLIRFIVVTPRQGARNRVHDVILSASRNDIEYTECATIGPEDFRESTIAVKECQPALVGRFVKAEKSNSTVPLTICEFQVYDKYPFTTTVAPTTTPIETTTLDINPSPTISADLTNFALNKPTSQSSVSGGKNSTLAVDGNKSPRSEDGSCTRTKVDETVWWKVDLRNNFIVKYIVITNRNTAKGTLIDTSMSVSLDDVHYTECGTVTEADVMKSLTIVKECGPEIVGRFVLAKRKNNTATLVLCEVEVFDQYPFTTTQPPTTTIIKTTTLAIDPSPTMSPDVSNFALNKPTSQSSVLWGKNSTLAVDGNTSPRMDNGSCTRTKVDETVWWKVDLRNNFIVRYIVITNRNVAKVDLINVSLSVSPDDVHFTECGTVTAADVKKSLTIVKECNPEIVGRFVKAERTNNTAKLTLCEVEVFDQYPFTTTRAPTTTPVRKTTLAIDASPTMSQDVSNFALDKPTWQSSVQSKRNSTLAVDGNTSSFIEDRSCSRTKNDETVWWKVDLRNNFIVRYIVITNRNVGVVTLINVTMSVSLDDIHYTECGTVTAADVFKSLTVVMECNPEIVGRFVKAERTNNTYSLTLCEVQVFDQYPFTTTRAPTTRPPTTTTIRITTAGPPTTTTQPSTMAYVSSTTSEDPFPTTMVSTTLPIETTTSRTTTSRTTTGTTTSTTSTTVLSSVLTTALSSTSALSTSSPRKVTTDVYESSVSTGDTHSKTTSKSSTIGVSNTARTSSPTIRSNSTTTAVPLITFTPTGDSTNATTTTAGIQPINSTHITTHATTEKPLTRSPGSASRVAPSLLLTKVEENPWNTTKHLSPTAVISYLASNSTKKITTTLNTDFNQTTNNIPINATALIPITTSDTHTSSTADNTPATNGSIEITTLTTGNTSKSATSDASTTTENLSATKTVDTTKITTNKKQITETTVVNASTTTGITTSTTMGGSVSVSAQTPRISSQDPSDPGLTSEGKLTNSSWSIEEHTSIVSSDYPHATTAAARTETTIQRTTSVAACNDPSSDGTLSPGGDDGLEYHKFTAENSTTLVFKCKEGFGMIGKATIECVNGEWVGNVPICENKKRHQNSTQETPLQLDGSLPTQAQPQGIPYTETKNVDNLIYAVVGCIFGVVALLTTVIGFILMALLRRRKKKKEDKEEDVDNDSVKSLDGDETSSTTPIGDPANPARRNSYNVLSKGSFYEVLDLDKLENQNGNLVSNRHRPSWQWTGGLESSTSWTDPGNHLKLERKFSRVYDTDV